jgi:hypothetical protein
MVAVPAAVCVAPFAAAAQGSPGNDCVLRTTLSHFVQLDREAARRGPEAVRFDPRPLTARWSEGPDPRILPPWPMQPAGDAAERDPKRVAGITSGIAAPGTSRAIIRCPREWGSSGCHMNGALMLIQASEPVVRDDRAKVFVRKLRLRASNYQSLGESFYVVTLARSGSGWTVTDALLFGVS